MRGRRYAELGSIAASRTFAGDRRVRRHCGSSRASKAATPPGTTCRASVGIRCTATPCRTARERISCQRLALAGPVAIGAGRFWCDEERPALGTAGGDFAGIGAEGQLDDLAIGQCLDHFLRTGGDREALLEAPADLLQQPGLLARDDRVDYLPNLFTDLRLPPSPGVRRFVDDPMGETLRQKRAERLEYLVLPEQDDPLVGPAFPGRAPRASRGPSESGGFVRPDSRLRRASGFCGRRPSAASSGSSRRLASLGAHA